MYKKLFIHLRYGMGINSWEEGRRKKIFIDKSPYNYHLAEKYGYKVEFSYDKKESLPFSILRKFLLKIFGFDLIHALRNLKNMENSDIIWTHTEYEFLAILFLLRKLKKKKKPKIICQVIWLADKWKTIPFWKKHLYKWLLKEADILTFLSSLNLRFMEIIVPEIYKKQVLFGICLDSFPLKEPKIRNIKDEKIKVLSIGNDQHRDWNTLLKALGNRNDIDLRIITHKLDKSIEKYYFNLKIINQKYVDEIYENYEWADIVVVPLKENLHASGITVMLEATTQGKPLICSDTGGLRDYFSDKDVFFVPVENFDKLYEAVQLLKDHEIRQNLVKNAQKTFLQKDLTSEGFIKRHHKITQYLLKEIK